jgi:hypothetical protein
METNTQKDEEVGISTWDITHMHPEHDLVRLEHEKLLSHAP